MIVARFRWLFIIFASVLLSLLLFFRYSLLLSLFRYFDYYAITMPTLFAWCHACCHTLMLTLFAAAPMISAIMPDSATILLPACSAYFAPCLPSDFDLYFSLFLSFMLDITLFSYVLTLQFCSFFAWGRFPPVETLYLLFSRCHYYYFCYHACLMLMIFSCRLFRLPLCHYFIPDVFTRQRYYADIIRYAIIFAIYAWCRLMPIVYVSMRLICLLFHYKICYFLLLPWCLFFIIWYAAILFPHMLLITLWLCHAIAHFFATLSIFWYLMLRCWRLIDVFFADGFSSAVATDASLPLIFAMPCSRYCFLLPVSLLFFSFIIWCRHAFIMLSLMLIWRYSPMPLLRYFSLLRSFAHAAAWLRCCYFHFFRHTSDCCLFFIQLLLTLLFSILCCSLIFADVAADTDISLRFHFHADALSLLLSFIISISAITPPFRHYADDITFFPITSSFFAYFSLSMFIIISLLIISHYLHTLFHVWCSLLTDMFDFCFIWLICCRYFSAIRCRCYLRLYADSRLCDILDVAPYAIILHAHYDTLFIFMLFLIFRDAIFFATSIIILIFCPRWCAMPAAIADYLPPSLLRWYFVFLLMLTPMRCSRRLMLIIMLPLLSTRVVCAKIKRFSRVKRYLPFAHY